MTGGVWYKMLISIRTWSRVVYRPSRKTADHWQQARSIIKSLLRLSYFYQFDYNTLPCNMTHRYRGTNYPHNHTTLHRTLRAFCCIIIAMILAASQHSQKTSISFATALKSPTPIIASSSGQVSVQQCGSVLCRNVSNEVSIFSCMQVCHFISHPPAHDVTHLTLPQLYNYASSIKEWRERNLSFRWCELAAAAARCNRYLGQ